MFKLLNGKNLSTQVTRFMFKFSFNQTRLTKKTSTKFLWQNFVSAFRINFNVFLLRNIDRNNNYTQLPNKFFDYNAMFGKLHLSRVKCLPKFVDHF